MVKGVRRCSARRARRIRVFNTHRRHYNLMLHLSNEGAPHNGHIHTNTKNNTDINTIT